MAAPVSHGRDSRTTCTPVATGRFGNIVRRDGISRATTAVGHGLNPSLGSKVSASRARSANPAGMNFAVSDPGSAAVCREQFRPVSEDPEEAAAGANAAYTNSQTCRQTTRLLRPEPDALAE
jgi:hypothetical protein